MGSLSKLKFDAATDSIKVSDGAGNDLGINASGEISIDTIATITNVVSVDDNGSTISIDDGGGSITVDGSVSIGSQAFVYAEDSVHTTGDQGSFGLNVRLDTRASTAGASGDYAGFVTNANGELYVIDTDGNALLTTIDADTGNIATDTAAMVVDLAAIEVELLDQGTSLDTISGDTTSIDALLTALSKAEDSAHVSGDQGIMGLAVANHTEGAIHSADGDYAPLQVDASGRLRVIGDLDVVGNVADDAADSGNPLKIGSRSHFASAVLSALSANGDRADLLSDAYRRIYTNDAPNVGISTAQINADTTVGGTNLVPSRQAGATRLYLRNTGSQDVYLGASGVTTGTGMLLGKDEALEIPLGEALNLYAITASGTATVHVMQLG